MGLAFFMNMKSAAAAQAAEEERAAAAQAAEEERAAAAQAAEESPKSDKPKGKR